MYACFNEAGKADGLRTRKIIPDNGESYITGERQYNNGTLEVVKTSNCRTGEIAAKNIGLYERYNSKIRFPDFAIENLQKILILGISIRERTNVRDVLLLLKDNNPLLQ